MESNILRTSWDAVMDVEHNPLRTTNLVAAHMVMQILAWMWSVIFAVALGSYLAFGVSAIAHSLVLGGVFVTLTVFRLKERSN
ncbi:hypothetical protein MUY35_09440 [Aliiroseovarius sp. S1339]|uniref:hypothetical protein n=1 Tax=Aliiroseovarius sp. S1339 TaxID=2936990 RepID=UPI0020BF9BDB|nr:hypothetical protein [Aliiroseovarius sp. S1339]MCK8464072.1 hypothetical protein [Aliiroseovarius sp. S1339]